MKNTYEPKNFCEDDKKKNKQIKKIKPESTVDASPNKLMLNVWYGTAGCNQSNHFTNMNEDLLDSKIHERIYHTNN